MNKKKVFIDGREGTTGLRIADRLAGRDDITLLTLPAEERKNVIYRKEMLNSADIAFLCLPDEAAVEACGLTENPETKIIDASTAHRTAQGWAYGFPELSQWHRDKIVASKRTAVPGCHAGGFISLVFPLVNSGILSPEALLTCFSLTGYSGGGKKMIAQYEAENREKELSSPRLYGLNQSHKHLPEMTAVCRLSNKPAFCPVVDDFYSGMEVTVPVFSSMLLGGAGVADIKRVYSELYRGRVVTYAEESGALLAAGAFSGTDGMRISVLGNDERILLVSRFDNLGKGASGAAVQCMNLMLGCDETKGLEL